MVLVGGDDVSNRWLWFCGVSRGLSQQNRFQLATEDKCLLGTLLSLCMS